MDAKQQEAEEQQKLNNENNENNAGKQQQQQWLQSDGVAIASPRQRFAEWLGANWRALMLPLAPLLLLPVLLVHGDSTEGRCAFLLLLMAAYWVTECLPLCITSLLPICLGPLLRLSAASKIAPVYFSDTNMLFLGGLMFAVAVERCRLHERIATGILRLFGSQPRWLLLGMMLPAWLLSMIISNTAATAMLLPLTDAAGGAGEEEEGEQPQGSGAAAEAGGAAPAARRRGVSAKQLRCALSLGVAFAANIGGIGTLIGTPPNLILAGILTEFGSTEVNFLSWMMYGLPLSAICIVITWVMLQACALGPATSCVCRRGTEAADEGRLQQQEQGDQLQKKTKEAENQEERQEQSQQQQLQQGPMTFAEKMVLAVLILLTLLWMTRSLGGVGWGRFFGSTDDKKPKPIVSDSTPVLVAVLLLFALPSKPSLRAERLLTWDAVRREFPWDIILLMGGSLALARLAKLSGLSDVIGQQLELLGQLPSPVLVMLLPQVMAWMTQLLSNSAATSLTLPVLLSLCSSIGVNPLLLMLPVTVASSLAFCLPVATPPNAIAYCKGHVTVGDMARNGAVLTFGLGLLVGLYTLAVAHVGMFGMADFPDWANRTAPA